MSFQSLLDHTAKVWRMAITYGDLREEKRGWSTVATVPCAVKRPSALIGQMGAGLVAIGQRTIYMNPEVDVRERDVVELVTGPDSGKFEVDAPVTRPRGHHVELKCRHFLGEL